MKKIVVSSVLSQNKENAGSKAKNDIRKILVNHGYISLDIKVPKSKVKKIFYAEYNVKSIIKNNIADEYVLQYPLYSMIVIKRLIKYIRIYSKKSKIVMVIHDVEALRQRKNDQKYINKEIQILNKADALIVHNLSMKKYLSKIGIKIPMVELNLFDYLSDFSISDEIDYKKEVCFAGNLNKANFLNKLKFNSVKLNVYGLPKSENFYDKGVIYKGSFDPDILPKYLEGNFGLVWDGDSVKTNTGIFGEYTRFNSPHKVSLYLSTGIPIIVWSEAAIAPYIQNNKLGIMVNRIDDLDDVLSSISLEEYTNLRINVRNYAKRIRSGKNLLDALNKVRNYYEK